jgi:uncharacterized protein (TIGR04255 family)
MTGELAPQPYKRPPITEAVIGVQFAAPIAADELRKISIRYNHSYPGEQQVKNIGVHVTNFPGRKPSVTNVQETIGYRRATDDATEIVLFTPNMLIVSQLAPYPGWEMFFGRFVRDWTLWKREMGFHKISRLGVRYINRVDIPNGEIFVEHEKYLNIYVQLPDVLGPTSSYAAQVVLPIKDLDSQLTINTGIMPSPLLNHTSFLIDIDIGRAQDVPQRDEDVFAFLTTIRDRKNMAFEACITDQARELFLR